MDISVVVATYNQAERLRLVLCGLANQTLGENEFEIIVVDDGSTDQTLEVFKKTDLENIKILTLGENRGRNFARNRGIDKVSGKLVVFLDGDALPAPDLLEKYLEAFQQYGQKSMFCGFQYSLPSTEFFQDPQTGALVNKPMPSVVKDYIKIHKESMVVTEKMVKYDFKTIHTMAQEGGYPFQELKELQNQVHKLLKVRPDAAVKWLGFVPHNGAIPLTLLRDVGGFDEKISFCEGWELAYRLHQMGVDIYPTKARSYHLYHYHPFSDSTASESETLVRFRAIEYMVRKHKNPRIWLLHLWFAHFWSDQFIPEEGIKKR